MKEIGSKSKAETRQERKREGQTKRRGKRTSQMEVRIGW
jgi:hypothetical protein